MSLGNGANEVPHWSTYLTNMSTPVISISREMPFHDLDKLNFCLTLSGSRGSTGLLEMPSPFFVSDVLAALVWFSVSLPFLLSGQPISYNVHSNSANCRETNLTGSHRRTELQPQVHLYSLDQFIGESIFNLIQRSIKWREKESKTTRLLETAE